MKVKNDLDDENIPKDPNDVLEEDQEDNGDDEEEEVEYFNPEMSEVYRIISCDTPSVSHSTAKSPLEIYDPSLEPDAHSNGPGDENGKKNTTICTQFFSIFFFFFFLFLFITHNNILSNMASI